jgi:hypothetical protein
MTIMPQDIFDGGFGEGLDRIGNAYDKISGKFDRVNDIVSSVDVAIGPSTGDLVHWGTNGTLSVTEVRNNGFEAAGLMEQIQKPGQVEQPLDSWVLAHNIATMLDISKPTEILKIPGMIVKSLLGDDLFDVPYDPFDPPNPWETPSAPGDLPKSDGYSHDPSRPGTLHPDPASSPTPRGPAVNETRPGFSAPSPTGYAGRGVNDLEGPEAGGRGGNGGGSYDDVKSPSKNMSTPKNISTGGNGGSDNNGTHKGSAPGTTSSTGNGPGFSANTGPVNSGTGPQNTSSKSSTKTADKNKNTSGNSTDQKYGPQPILLDLDGDGVQITELNRSTKFIDGGEGLLHRTAWAAAGNGVLFFDPDGRNAITEKRQYVFTEWNPTASGDLEALRSVWDTNGDGKLTAADTEFAKFKVLVTNADGTTTVQTLTQLGVTEINLTADTTYIESLDGSLITGQTTYLRGNDTTGTVVNMVLMAA